jgi:protein-L-isoaspartate(D-aspartate) O-methyltransferase
MTSARTRDRLVQRLIEQGIRNREVLECIRSTPRHLFIDEALSSRAYEDTALPIGFGQTISQPYIVARMTEALLEVGPLHNVLEVGTGCGYQTAILAALVPRLHSIERIEALHLRAQQRLQELGATHVRLRHGDGYEGWRANAPYDGILVAAAPPEVPEALLRQLAPGGRLVMPVGDDRKQVLLRVTRRDGGYEREMLGPVSFVPLQSGLVSDTGTAGR